MVYQTTADKKKASSVTKPTFDDNAYQIKYSFPNLKNDPAHIRNRFIPNPPCSMLEQQQQQQQQQEQQQQPDNYIFYQQSNFRLQQQHSQNDIVNIDGNTVMAMAHTEKDRDYEQFDINGNSNKMPPHNLRLNDIKELQQKNKLDKTNSQSEIGKNVLTITTEKRKPKINFNKLNKFQQDLQPQKDTVDAGKFKDMSREELIARLVKLENERKLLSLRNNTVALNHNSEDDNMSDSSISVHAIYVGIEEEEEDPPNSSVTTKENSSIAKTCLWYECGEKFDLLQDLITHLAEAHVGGGKPTYRCEWENCARNDKPFTKRHKMLNHLRIHTGERPFVCPKPNCEKKFSRPDSLTTHIKTHSTVKPYMCRYRDCGKAYYHLRSLKKHERLHETALMDSKNNNDDVSITQQALLQQQQQQRRRSQPFQTLPRSTLQQQSIEIPANPSTHPPSPRKSLLHFPLTTALQKPTTVQQRQQHNVLSLSIPQTPMAFEQTLVTDAGAAILVPSISFQHNSLSIYQQQQHSATSNGNLNNQHPSQLQQHFSYTVPEPTISPFIQNSSDGSLPFTLFPSSIPIPQQAFADITSIITESSNH